MTIIIIIVYIYVIINSRYLEVYDLKKCKHDPKMLKEISLKRFKSHTNSTFLN